VDAKVRDVMTPGAIGVDYDHSIAETARTMRDWGVGAVIVVRRRSLCGILTDRDLVVRALAESLSPDEAVGPLCTGEVVTVDAGADLRDAALLMRRHAIRRLPVMAEGLVVGIISRGDLALHENPGPISLPEPAPTRAIA
jgi:signal-transduction protein with cAMP-binding, CBS, and nucleotidyltransferase domain